MSNEYNSRRLEAVRPAIHRREFVKLLAALAAGPLAAQPAAGAVRRLIVNADDFGLTRGVSEGIIAAHCTGIVTATTVLADAAAFEHGAELLRATPTLDAGVHLVLWPDGMSFFPFLGRVTKWSSERVEKEFARQVEKALAAGLTISHLDTHKHTHIYPKVMSALVRVARRYKIRWLRRAATAAGIRKHGLWTADHFRTERPDRKRLRPAIRSLQPGLTEWMTHCGFYDAELERVSTRLKRQRQREFEALTAPEVRELLREFNVELTSFAALDQLRSGSATE
jgi:predicted glycoside hydrolase/deacetylase ChbG (UPF0249 family)